MELEPPRRPRLLVVDDEHDILDFVERVFRRDYLVERASSVEEALPLLERGVVDVIISDRRMPHQSGEQLLSRAAALQPAALRILLTGYSEETAASEAVDAWLHKPVDAEELTAAVAEAQARRAAPR